MRMRMRMRDFAAPDELKRFARNKCRMAVLSSHAMAELAGLDTARLQREGTFVCLSHMWDFVQQVGDVEILISVPRTLGNCEDCNICFFFRYMSYSSKINEEISWKTNWVLCPAAVEATSSVTVCCWKLIQNWVKFPFSTSGGGPAFDLGAESSHTSRFKVCSWRFTSCRCRNNQKCPKLFAWPFLSCNGIMNYCLKLMMQYQWWTYVVFLYFRFTTFAYCHFSLHLIAFHLILFASVSYHFLSWYFIDFHCVALICLILYNSFELILLFFHFWFGVFFILFCFIFIWRHCVFILLHSLLSLYFASFFSFHFI